MPHPGLGVQWVLIASGEESNFEGYPFSFATVEDMKEKAHDSRHQDEQYIGRGFIWENRHAQAAFEITKSDYYTTFISDGGCTHNFGMGWLHGMEPKKQTFGSFLHTPTVIL